jgi:hypothetical protein
VDSGTKRSSPNSKRTVRVYVPLESDCTSCTAGHRPDPHCSNVRKIVTVLIYLKRSKMMISGSFLKEIAKLLLTLLSKKLQFFGQNRSANKFDDFLDFFHARRVRHPRIHMEINCFLAQERLQGYERLLAPVESNDLISITVAHQDWSCLIGFRKKKR